MSYPPLLTPAHYDVSKETLEEDLKFVKLQPVAVNPGPTNDTWINSATGHLMRGTFDLETLGGMAVTAEAPPTSQINEVAIYPDTTGKVIGNSNVLLRGGASGGTTSVYLTTQTVPNTTGLDNTVLNGGKLMTTNAGCVYVGNDGVAAENNAVRIGDPTQQTTCFVAGIPSSTFNVESAFAKDLVMIDRTTKQLTPMVYEEFTFTAAFQGYTNTNTASGGVHSGVAVRVTRIGNFVNVSVPPDTGVADAADITYFVSTTTLPGRFIPSVDRTGVARTGQTIGDINKETGMCLVAGQGPSGGLIYISRSNDINETIVGFTFVNTKKGWETGSCSYAIV